MLIKSPEKCHPISNKSNKLCPQKVYSEFQQRTLHMLRYRYNCQRALLHHGSQIGFCLFVFVLGSDAAIFWTYFWLCLQGSLLWTIWTKVDYLGCLDQIQVCCLQCIVDVHPQAGFYLFSK